MPKVAVTYSPVVGGSSVVSLKESFQEVGSEVVNADYRDMMADIPVEEFNKLYSTPKGREKLFAHAKAKAVEVLRDVDCLALSGNSAMIDPELFNKERDAGQSYDLSRTIAELALVHVATERGMPMLGVCGGHQVIAVHGGGAVTDLNATQIDKQRFMNYDAINFNKDSMLAQIIGGKDLTRDFEGRHYEGEFFGAHYQVVSSLGKGFKQTGTASDDESIESAESEFGVPILTTQFHPEVAVKGLPGGTEFMYKRTKQDVETNLRIFEYLNEAAKSYGQKKTMLDELRQLKPDDDNVLIEPSQVKARMQEAQRAKQSESTPEVVKTPEKSSIGKIIAAGFSAFAGAIVGIGSTIGSAWKAVKETISPIIGRFLRNIVSDVMTSVKVSALRKKEAGLKVDSSNPGLSDPKGGLSDPSIERVPPTSLFSGTLQQLTNKAPGEILRETPAQLWTKQTDDEPVVVQMVGDEVDVTVRVAPDDREPVALDAQVLPTKNGP